MLAAILLALLAATRPSPDLNGDGAVSFGDLGVMKRYIFDWPPVTLVSWVPPTEYTDGASLDYEDITAWELTVSNGLDTETITILPEQVSVVDGRVQYEYTLPGRGDFTFHCRALVGEVTGELSEPVTKVVP